MSNQNEFPKIIIFEDEHGLKGAGIDFDEIENSMFTAFYIPSYYFKERDSIMNVSVNHIKPLSNKTLSDIKQNHKVENEMKLMGVIKMENKIKLGQVYKMKDEGIYTIPISFAKSDYSDVTNSYIVLVTLDTRNSDDEDYQFNDVKLTFSNILDFYTLIEKECCNIDSSILTTLSNITHSRILINATENDSFCYKIIDSNEIENNITVEPISMSEYISSELKHMISNILYETPWNMSIDNESLYYELTIHILHYKASMIKIATQESKYFNFRLRDNIQTAIICGLESLSDRSKTVSMNVKKDSLELYTDANGISIFQIEFETKFVYDNIKRGDENDK